MKIVYLVFAILLHAYIVSCASSKARNEPHNWEDVIRDKCLKNSHDVHAFDKLQQAEKDYRVCLHRFERSNPPSPITEHEEFCQFVKENNLHSCLKNLVRNIKPCLDESEMYLPHLMLNVYTYGYNKICGVNGHFHTEYLFNKTQRNYRCMGEQYAKMMWEGRCLANLTTIKNFQNNIMEFSKDIYCHDMPNFVDCVTDLLNSNCEENFDFFVSELSRPFLEVCQKSQPPKIQESVTTSKPSYIRPDFSNFIRF